MPSELLGWIWTPSSAMPRDGSVALDAPGLAEYLRESAVNQLAIDQPGYAGLRTALARGGPGS